MISFPIRPRTDLVIVFARRNGPHEDGYPYRTWYPITRVFLNYVGRHAIVICPGYGMQWVGGGGSCAFIWTYVTAFRMWWIHCMREARKTAPSACFPEELAQAQGKELSE